MNRIAELRKIRGFSQSELSKMLGIAQNTLSQYENGTRTPSATMLIRLSEVFQLSTRYIMAVDEAVLQEDNSLMGVTALREAETLDDANAYLSLGLKLLCVSEASPKDSTCFYYLLGWYGKPSDCPTLPDGWDAQFEEW